MPSSKIEITTKITKEDVIEAGKRHHLTKAFKYCKDAYYPKKLKSYRQQLCISERQVSDYLRDLVSAIRLSELDIIDRLVKNNPSFLSELSNGEHIISYADSKTLNFLVSRHSDAMAVAINTQNALGNTPVMSLVSKALQSNDVHDEKEFEKKLGILLYCNPSFDIKNNEGKTFKDMLLDALKYIENHSSYAEIQKEMEDNFNDPIA